MILNLAGRNKVRVMVVMRGIVPCFVAVISILVWGAALSYGQEVLSISGITEPVKEVTLSMPVPGIISTIFFKEGAKVKKGQCILELEKRIEELEVERRKVVWKSEAELIAASERVATLKSLLESTRELFKSTRSVSEEDLEKSELEYKLAMGEQQRLEVVEKRERIEYEMALENLHKRSMRSPIQGTIIKLYMHEGESCEEHQPLVDMVDTSRCLLVCNAEEGIGRTLKKGQSVDLKIRAGSESIAKKGTIVFVSPVVDQASSLLEVKAEFDNKGGAVRPGVAGVMLLKVR